MPVPIVVVWLATLLVSSLSKMALVGSTVTVFVMVPVVAGAERTIVIVTVDCGGMVPPVQVTTFAPSTLQANPPVVEKLSKIRPAGSGSRTMTPVAARMPLLPTVYV